MGVIINNLSKTKKLGEILIDAGLLNATQLETALTEGKKRNMRLGSALTALGILSEDNILDALSSQIGLKKIDLSKLIIDPAVGRLISEGLSRQFKMVGISLAYGILTVALSDPLNVFATDALKRNINYNIDIVLAKEHDISKSIDFVWTAKDLSKAASYQNVVPTDNKNFTGLAARQAGAADFSSSPSASAAVKEVLQSEDVNIIKLVNDIIFSASKNRASDIHIEPLSDEMIVRERIDGELTEARRIPFQFLNPVIARIKIMANMDIAEKRNPHMNMILIHYCYLQLQVRSKLTFLKMLKMLN